jgi:ABC-type spermidine/putrescine transport system permease subunit I
MTRRSPIGVLPLLVPALALVGALYALPIVKLAALSFGEGEAEFSAQAYAELFGPWSYTTILLRTVIVSAFVTLGCLLFGYPIGYVLAFSPPRRRALIALLVLLPFWTSVLVRTFAWSYLLRSEGLFSRAIGLDVLYNEAGVVIAMVNTLLPFMVLPVAVTLLAQDRALREAAMSLGAAPARVFFDVTLPLSRAGIVTGSVVVFSIAMGYFVTPALLGGGRVLVAATFISQQIEDFVNWPLAAAASMVLLAIILALVALFARAGRPATLEQIDARH